MPLGTHWARKSQFNWCYSAIAGTPLQNFVAGLYSGKTYTVTSNQIVIPAADGGGSIYYLRGVWKLDALFAWGGFWADAESGTDYYAGGSYVNNPSDTTITLGTGLPDSTEVQVYFIYNTGLHAAKYDALNSTPCIREAWRSKTDYTYDFAVDRIFDLMAAVYFAYKEQGLDDETILDFLWQSYINTAASHSGELVYDDFNRSYYDRSSYLIYYNSTEGQAGFDQFGTQLPTGDQSGKQALRFKPAYYEGSAFSAWFGYGFSWDLTPAPFNGISKVKFKAFGSNEITRIQRFIKTAGSGDANLVLIDEFDNVGLKYYKIEVTSGGAPGVAQATVSLYTIDLTLEGTDSITCPGEGSYVNLGYDLKAYWESGTLSVGDTWYITCGTQEIAPHRLLVTLNDSVPADPDPWGEAHTFVHAVTDNYTEFEDFEIDFSQFWRLGNIIDCRDRKRGYWGGWSNHLMAVGSPYEQLFYDIFDPEEIDGETFYTKLRFSWNLSATLLALGFYVGIPADVDSTGATNINFLVKNNCGVQITLRTKVRDAGGSYSHVDETVYEDVWTRVTIPLASFGALTHPLDLVDIGIPDLTGGSIPGLNPTQGSFDICDLKFDEHLLFEGSNNLRIVEFKHQEISLKLFEGPDWYVDDFGFDLSVSDTYPYAPRLAISLNAYGRNSWRGPTLVHYSHPLAPFLVGETAIVTTELALHSEAQAEFTSRYGGDPGPVMPVHTRNDIENVALLGTENFNKFCWWEDYPETGSGLAQYWGFYRLGEYYFVSGDAGAWAILDNWLDWLTTYVIADGDGWKFPVLFGDSYGSGFDYGDYDPGQAASIAIGCLYVYMKTEDSRALALAQKILTDLRENRFSGDYGGHLYKSDYHYAWMNALVAHAFGLAVVGRAGAAYGYPFIAAEETYFDNIMNSFWILSGDSKPNLLNSDLIPFHAVEASDIWDYAPDYMFMSEMGSMEAVVLMLHTAIDWALYDGSWDWFNTLLGFVIDIGLGFLAEKQIYSMLSAMETTKIATQVGLTYGNFRQDNTLYKEAEDAGLVASLGAIKTLLPLHYGNPVITESEATAETLCNRYLDYFAAPKETLQVEADLAAARFDLDDVIRITSDFHGFDDTGFYLTRRLYDPKKLRVMLSLMRDNGVK